MKYLNLPALALPVLALAFGAWSPHGPPPPDAVDALAYPAAAGPIEIPGQVDGRPTTVADLLELYAAATGQQFVQTPEDAERARSTSLGLADALTVPAERVQAVFEGLLIEREFVLQVVSAEGQRLLSARSLRVPARADARGFVTFVASDRIDVMRAHPAMVLTTIVDLPGVDARQVANAMRTMLTDAGTQQIQAAGSSNSLVVTAPGGLLATLIETLGLVRDRGR